MISYGGGDSEGLYFDHGFLGDRARLLQCLYHTYVKWEIPEVNYTHDNKFIWL